MVNWSLTVTFLLISFLCVPLFGDEYSVADLVALNQSAISKFEKIELEFSEKVDENVSFTGKWARLGLKDLYSEDAVKDGISRRVVILLDRAKQMEHRMRIPDSKKIPDLLPHQAFGAFGVECPLGRYHSDVSVFSRLALRFHVYGQDDTLTLKQLVAESESARVAPNREVNGMKCHVIEIKRLVSVDNKQTFLRVCLNPEKGFLVSRVEIFFGEDEKAEKFVGDMKIDELENGTFFPTGADWSLFNPGEDEPRRTIVFETKNRHFNSDVKLKSIDYQHPINLWVQVWDIPFNPMGPGAGLGHKLMGKNGQVQVEFSKEQRSDYGVYRKKLFKEANLSNAETSTPEIASSSERDPRESKLGRGLFLVFAIGSFLVTLYLVVQIGFHWRKWSKAMEA